MFYYLYVLQSVSDKKLYTGVTKNLKKRIAEHNRGENKSTKGRRPFRLIYFEGYRMKKDAFNRKKYLKTSMGKRVFRKQNINFLKKSESDKIELAPLE